MRELKFRAFNLLDKGFCLKPMQFANSRGEFEFDFGGKLAYSYTLYEAIKSKDVVVMQYTGMKDKSGVEIYEGDIIKLYDNTKGYLTVVFKNQYAGGWVLHREEDGEGRELSLGAREPKEVEVIGNVYQNPELLNDNL